MEKKGMFLILLVMSVGVTPLAAQWSKSLSVSTAYDNNAFRNYEGLSDYVTQISAYLARDGGSGDWQSRIYYRGGYNIFANFAQRNFHSHQAGVALAYSFNNRQALLNLGGNGGLRWNRDLYSYYNFTTASAFANLKLDLTPASLAHLGYRVRGRWYANLPEFSNVEHYLFARFTHFFESKTTLILEMNYGRKIYLQQAATGSGEAQDWDHRDRHDRARGHMGNLWWGDAGDPGESRYAVGQAVGLVRLAQSLDNSTGFSVQFLLRRNPTQTVRYLAGQVSGYSTEDELFDDRYGYESRELRSTLTRLLPWRMTLAASGEIQWKDYVSRPALDLSGQPVATGEARADRRLAAWLTLSKTLSLSQGRRDLTLFSELYWIDNRSNDEYYRYSNVTFSIGLSTAF